MSDPETLRVYEDRASDYAGLVDNDTPDATLAAFIARLRAGAHVLDLGCGPGGSSRHLARAGCVVDATDAAPAMVALAARVPGVNARLASFDDIVGTDIYDAVWANFSLLHAPRADMPRHLAAIRTALKSGGPFHIALKEGIGARRDALGRHYSYYTRAELTGLLQQAGFHPGPFQSGAETGLDGVVAPWISVTSDG